MRIFNENNVEITSPDLTLGYLKEDKIFVQHHDAIEFVPEVWHYEVVAEYPNGGKDVAKVIDTPTVQAQEAWDEYEDIQRYVLYTKEELIKIEEERTAQEKEKSKPSIEDRVAAMELALLEFLGVAIND